MVSYSTDIWYPNFHILTLQSKSIFSLWGIPLFININKYDKGLCSKFIVVMIGVSKKSKQTEVNK